MDRQSPIKSRQGTNLGGASAHNRRVVLQALRLNGALSRADLARSTGLTGQTVSNIVGELETDGLVVADAPIRMARGQPATPYRLVAEGAFALGVQIDRHGTRVVAVDLLGYDLVRLEAPLPTGGPEAGLPVVIALIAEARRQLAVLIPDVESRLAGLGLAMPGPFGLAAQDEDLWMMSAWQNFPLLESLAIGTGLEVALQNDAAAAATAEKLSGVAKGLEDFVYLYLGYGLGAGLVLKGEVYSGGRRNAGEIGMAVPLAPEGEIGDLLEHVVSIAGLCRAMDFDPADPELYARIDKAIASAPMRAWIAIAAPRLRWAIQLLETLLDPQTIILGGSAPASLFAALQADMLPLLRSNAERADRPLPRLTLGRADPWMVALGAAAEPISRAFDPRFSAIQKARLHYD